MEATITLALVRREPKLPNESLKREKLQGKHTLTGRPVVRVRALLSSKKIARFLGP